MASGPESGRQARQTKSNQIVLVFEAEWINLNSEPETTDSAARLRLLRNRKTYIKLMLFFDT
jgi:hypothetical protein